MIHYVIDQSSTTQTGRSVPTNQFLFLGWQPAWAKKIDMSCLRQSDLDILLEKSENEKLALEELVQVG